MMKLRRFFAAILLCAAAVMLLAACGGGHTYTLNYANLSMSVGQEQQLTVTADPEKEISAAYESSDPAVATVSESGLVTAVAAGSAEITVKADEVTLTCKVAVSSAQSTWSLNYGAAIVGVGATLKLQPSVLPEKEFTAAYSTSDAAVATVAEDGTVTGVAEGKAVITADVGEMKLTCEISVSASAKNYSYALNHTALEMYEGTDSNVLQLTVSPDKTAEVTYASSDPSVVTVDADGKVVAVSAGEAELYAESDGQKLTCKVTVLPMYVLNYKSSELRPDETLQLSVTNAIDETAVSGAQFASSDQNVATVSESGLVTAVSAGKATVTVTVGGKTLVCTVTVTAEEGNE